MKFFCLPKPDNKKAFTLIEVLLVILIISILAILAVQSYIVARHRGLLNMQADKIAESLREAQYKVLSGDSVSEKQNCLGMEFSDKIKKVSSLYKEDGKCDSNYKVLDTIELLNPIGLGGDGERSIVYFKPPHAEMFINKTVSQKPESKDEYEIVIQFGANDDKNWQKIIVVNPLTNSIKVK